MRDTAAPLDHTQVSSLQDLASDLRKDYLNRSLDGFGLYLYGIVQKRLDLSQGALEVLVEATHKEPLHWGAWLELATLITDRTKVLPSILSHIETLNHNIFTFFYRKMFSLQNNAVHIFSYVLICNLFYKAYIHIDSSLNESVTANISYCL